MSLKGDVKVISIIHCPIADQIVNRSATPVMTQTSIDLLKTSRIFRRESGLILYMYFKQKSATTPKLVIVLKIDLNRY